MRVLLMLWVCLWTLPVFAQSSRFVALCASTNNGAIPPGSPIQQSLDNGTTWGPASISDPYAAAPDGQFCENLAAPGTGPVLFGVTVWGVLQPMGWALADGSTTATPIALPVAHSQPTPPTPTPSLAPTPAPLAIVSWTTTLASASISYGNTVPPVGSTGWHATCTDSHGSVTQSGPIPLSTVNFSYASLLPAVGTYSCAITMDGPTPMVLSPLVVTVQ